MDEDALMAALDAARSRGRLGRVCGEPAPRADLLAHPKVALTPHIGAATGEAQDRIGLELAAQIDALA